jgi:hypothetical protein
MRALCTSIPDSVVVAEPSGIWCARTTLGSVLAAKIVAAH